MVLAVGERVDNKKLKPGSIVSCKRQVDLNPMIPMDVDDPKSQMTPNFQTPYWSFKTEDEKYYKYERYGCLNVLLEEYEIAAKHGECDTHPHTQDTVQYLRLVRNIVVR